MVRIDKQRGKAIRGALFTLTLFAIMHKTCLWYQTLKNGDSLDAKAVAAYPQQLLCI